MQHLTESLERVMAHNTIRYNGCLIYFTKGEYVWNRKGYKTIEETIDLNQMTKFGNS